MSMYGVLGSALSGLRATQAGLDLVARNVANADTPGYTKKSLDQSAIISGDSATGVRLGDVTRRLDTLVQRQLRLEMSGAGYVRTLSQYHEHLDMLFGAPGSAAGLDTIFNEFRGSIEALTTSPDSFTARDQVLRDAEVLAQTLNQTSADIQAMRLEAERGIGDAVDRINDLLVQISKINEEIGARTQNNMPPADLLDVRDRHITELSQLIDLRVVEKELGKVALFTQSGTLLLDLKPAELLFDERGTMTPEALYSADPDERNVGTVSLKSPNGLVIDLVKDRAIRSGELAALVELRDKHLVDAQAQLDAFAGSMARALSTRSVEGEAVSVGAQAGFDVDLSGMLAGDRVSLNYSVGGVEQSVTFVRVDDPASLPLDEDAVPGAGGRVVGIDFSGGFAAAAAAMAAELGPEIDVADQGGGMMRFLDDGAADTSSISRVSASVTATGFADGDMALPFFLDGGGGIPYSGRLDGTPQQIGFAGRIMVNPALLADNSKLVTYAASTPIGDPGRPTDLLRRLTESEQTYSGSVGIAGRTPYSGTVAGFLQRVIAHQGAQSADVARGREAQDIVVAQLEERFSMKSGVNIDEEMARLIELQAAFQANTRVVQAFREMMNLLLQL